MRSFLILFIVVLPFSLFGGGGKEDVSTEVQGLENWYAEVDLEEYPDKTELNLLVRARDKAGNEGVAGPYLIRVDHLSDIPQTFIKTPYQGMRIEGQVSVLGTAVDDDGIKYVEVRVGDEGSIRRAEGTQYWSYTFEDFSSMPDGLYEIQARAVDINGLANEEWEKVEFYLDRNPPQHSFTSHEMGALVTGDLRLEGKVKVSNGLDQLEWAIAPQMNWQKLGFSKTDEAETYQFNLNQNTRRLEDGPHVIWLRSKNTLGSTGETPFLFFSDNTAPEITLISPKADQASRGRVTIVGKVFDLMGVESLTYQVDKEEGEIPLVLGNPYWSLDLDFSGDNSRGKNISFTARDRIGNQVTRRFNFLLDPKGDQPVLHLQEPINGSQYQGKVPVVGWIEDENEVAAFYYQLPGEEGVKVPSSGGVSFLLENLSPGKQKVLFWAEDASGVLSDKQTIELTVIPESPQIFLDKAQSASGSRDFHPGFMMAGLSRDQDRIQGRVITAARLKSLSLEVAGQNSRNIPTRRDSNQTDLYTFDIAIDPTWSQGKTLFSLIAEDEFGAQSRIRSFYVHSTNNLRVVEEDEPSSVQNTHEFFHLVDSRIRENEPILIQERAPLRGFFFAGEDFEVSEFSFDPPTSLLRLETQGVPGGGYSLKILPQEAGVTPPIRIRANTSFGSSFWSQPLVFATDSEPPALEIVEPAPGAFVNKELVLVLKTENPGSLSKLEYAWKDQEFQDLKPLAQGRRSDGSTPYSFNLTSIADGRTYMRIRATDQSGNQSEVFYPLFKDTLAPVIQMITPEEGYAVDGLTSVYLQADKPQAMVSASYSTDGQNFQPMEGQFVWGALIDFNLYNEAKPFVFKVQDRYGNESTFSSSFSVDKEKDKPQVSIQVPAEGEVLRNDFYISGFATDDDEVKAIYYRLGDDPFVKVDGASSFSIAKELGQIPDAPHTVELYAEDIHGTKSDVIKRNFITSSSGPTSNLISPDLSQTQSGRVQLRGSSQDPNGVARVWISLDNGTTFALMQGAENWSYLLDTTVLADGLYSVILRAEDSTGAYGDYNLIFYVDNTPPRISLVNPKDGRQYSQFFMFEGRGTDNLGLAAMEYQIRNLRSGALALQGELPLTGGFSWKQETSALPPGWYNVEIIAKDEAGNTSSVARNIEVQRSLEADSLDIFFPTEGQRISGPIELEGLFTSQNPQARISLYVNDQVYTTFTTNEQGYFNRLLEVEEIQEFVTASSSSYGDYESLMLYLKVEKEDGTTLESPKRRVEYTQQGPWLTVDSHSLGDGVSGRPLLTGRAGFFGFPEPESSKEEKVEAKRFGPESITLRDIHRQRPVVQVSRDNGLSFSPANVSRMPNPDKIWEMEGVYQWDFQLETPDYEEGDLNLLVRVSYPEGTVLTTRQILQVDKTSPQVTLISPSEGGRFNQNLELVGTSGDNFDLEDVEVLLWQGFNREYQKSGLSGLYIEGAVFGMPGVLSGAIGGSALEGLAKIQVGGGWIPEINQGPEGAYRERFYGYNYHAKLLLNLISFPFSEFPLLSDLNPSMRSVDWLAFSAGVGANFTYFSMDDQLFLGEDWVVVPSALVQGELKFLTGVSMIESLGFFYEVSWAFISSDVAATIEPVLLHAGIRWQIF